nr:MAG TPA: hypothetical protein [Caudoviricetes sp.]
MDIQSIVKGLSIHKKYFSKGYVQIISNMI